jgi:hypothetical protein
VPSTRWCSSDTVIVRAGLPSGVFGQQ